MKIFEKVFPAIILALSFAVTLSGCQVIGDIFKAGVWVGILLVVVVVGIIVMIISKVKK